jgi:hypothetical protein
MMYDRFTYDEFDANYDTDFSLQDSHAEYILENCHGERNIGNGDMLIDALESGYLYEEFRDDYIASKENA